MPTLLDDIKQAIKQHGGRIKLALDIIQENHDYFTDEQEKYFTDRRKWQINANAKYVHTRSDFWSDEDVAYVVEKFGRVKTSVMAEILGRSAVRIRQKFAEVATEEQKQNVANLDAKWKKKSNFKRQKLSQK